MKQPASAWKRWTLLALLIAIGAAYIAAFTRFVTHSGDFVARSINEPARKHAATHPLLRGAALEFGGSGSGAAHLGSGWHPPEADGGTWSNWPDAWVFVSTPVSMDGAVLRLDADAYLSHRHPRMTVKLSGNGIELGTWRLDPSNTRLAASIDIPAEVMAQQPVALHFHVDAPSSPWHTRTGDDRRTLGIRLRSLAITPTESH